MGKFLTKNLILIFSRIFLHIWLSAFSIKNAGQKRGPGLALARGVEFEKSYFSKRTYPNRLRTLAYGMANAYRYPDDSQTVAKAAQSGLARWKNFHLQPGFSVSARMLAHMLTFIEASIAASIGSVPPVSKPGFEKGVPGKGPSRLTMPK